MSIESIAQKYNVSPEAVAHLAEALQRGNGTQAQFNHPEFGGMGQWQNGMIMIGDAFNQSLKTKVANIFADLSQLEQTRPISGFKPMAMPTMTRWWSDELGEATSVGQQNESQYAIFADKQRLVMRQSARIITYDTAPYRITGVSQAQSNQSQMIVFTTTTGKSVTIDDFKTIE